MFDGTQAPGARMTLSVAALLLAAGDALAARLGAVAVRGEISGFSRAASGHCYLTLKDSDGAAAVLRCAMFRRAAALLDFEPRDGLQVELRGRIGLYEPRGELQLVVEAMRRLGAGNLYEEFLRLRDRLQAQGLFDAARKRPLPAWPRRVAVVTSPAAAAWHDVMTALRRRAPQVEVVLVGSPVQGADAPPALAAALQRAGQLDGVDAVLLVRGGGSLEDLWAFNDERVVRAVAASRAPVICGVGHETDFTLCDFAADLRAPTPTAAAELATQTTLDDLRDDLSAQEARLVSLTLGLLADQQAWTSSLAARLRYVSPERQVQSAAQRVDDLSRRAFSALTHRIQLQASRVEGMSSRLLALNPTSILSRGYAIVTRQADGRVVGRVADAQGALKVRVSDGEFAARIDPQS